MKASVIIPVYNEEKAIEECLVSLSKQTFKDFEVIVVDDGSTDETPSLISKLQTSNIKLQILKQVHQGPAMARNLGASRASGEILVFVDADMTFDKLFLEELVAPIEKGKAKGTFSHEEYVSNWDNPWARFWSYNRGRFDKKFVKKRRKQKVFRAILRSEFDRVGGFDTGGYTDDYTLYKKLGYKAKAVKGARFYHKNPESLKEVFTQARWSAKREYKFGRLGTVYALFRASFPISMSLGLAIAIRKRAPKFLIFKALHDTAVIIGILEFYILEKASK